MSFLGWFNKNHKPDDVALVKDVPGQCNHCCHHGYAHLVAYYDGTILIRCNTCKTADEFVPDDAKWTDARRFLPFINDEDDEDDEKQS